MKVYIAGNPLDGYAVVGPFRDFDEADEAASNTERTVENWVVSVETAFGTLETEDRMRSYPVHVVIFGDLVNGHDFVGPFLDFDDAEDNLDLDRENRPWQFVKVISPQERAESWEEAE